MEAVRDNKCTERADRDARVEAEELDDKLAKNADKLKNLYNDTNGGTLISLADIEEKEAEWLFPGYVPRNTVFSLVGDGGIGKTTIWCDMAAAVSTGNKPFFMENHPFCWDAEPQPVLVFSAEDSVQYVLKKRLLAAGADEKMIHVMDSSVPGFSECKFGTEAIEPFYKRYKPGLVVFDPIQGFLPPSVNMAQRNAMRNCTAQLAGLSEKYGATTCLVVHTNKMPGASGRRRMADSADIWDVSRSVLIAGRTQEEGIRYLSHEKCNYGMEQETILFSIEDGTVQYEGASELKDHDYVQQERTNTQQAPAREEAEEFIISTLNAAETGEMAVAEVDGMARAVGISKSALKRAKTQLRKDGKIRIFSSGYAKTKVFYIALNEKEVDTVAEVVE